MSYPLSDDLPQPWSSSVFLIQQGLQDAAWNETAISVIITGRLGENNIQA